MYTLERLTVIMLYHQSILGIPDRLISSVMPGDDLHFLLDRLDVIAGIDTAKTTCKCTVHVNNGCPARRYVGARIKLHETAIEARRRHTLPEVGRMYGRSLYMYLGADAERV